MKLMIDLQQVQQVICGSYHTYENIVHDPNINTYMYTAFWTLEISRVQVETLG